MPHGHTTVLHIESGRPRAGSSWQDLTDELSAERMFRAADQKEAGRMRTAYCLAAATSAAAADDGLVAEYVFETVTDDQTPDSSRQTQSARIHQARPIPFEIGQALLFDGDGWIDCGSGPELDLRDAVSVECWVRPDTVPDSMVTIAGKGPQSYGLMYHRDGKCWWYVRGTGHKGISAALGTGVWQHVAGTYDGEFSRLYVDGKACGERALSGLVLPGESSLIGQGFRGAVAAVRVYNRALSPEEIARRHGAAGIAASAPAEPITDGEVLTGTGYQIRVGGGGAIQVQVGQDRFLIETMLSYPGEAIGWNRLGAQGSDGETGWQPATNKPEHGRVEVSIRGTRYAMTRTVALEGHRVVVTDELINADGEDVGILYRHQLATPQPFSERLLGGASRRALRMTAENPSVFVGQGASRLGWLGEDDVLRLQMAVHSTPNRVTISADHFALQPGRSHTFRWALYPLSAEDDYWTFVNQVRRDWGTNFTVVGPWDFFDLATNKNLIADSQGLRAYLMRKQLNAVAVQYVHYANVFPVESGGLEDYKTVMRSLGEAVKRIAPTVHVIGCMSGNFVSLPRALEEEILRLAPDKAAGQYLFTEEQVAAMRRHNIRWTDCLLVNREGKIRYQLYYRDGKPYVDPAVFAAPGNGQARYWMHQARHMIEEAGLDGVYVDQFSLAFQDAQRYSYHAWDGTTVDIDAQTGHVTQRYTDAALIGIDARRELADYVLSKGKYMLANTFPVTAKMQSVRMHRFNEAEWGVDVFSWEDGEKPPLIEHAAEGHFSTPIGLGVRPQRYGEKGLADYARVIHKGVICYLRNALLYYEYYTDIPDTGPGAGEYGAINHIFPITPVELHAGWIVGKQRIVTCVSRIYRCPGEERPDVLVFDMVGRPTTPQARIWSEGDGWRVDLRLQDWAEIAVIKWADSTATPEPLPKTERH